MVRGVISNSSILGIGYALNASARGKISLPVNPAALVYSHMRHVSGVPAPDGSSGLTINRLNILNVLIERMNSLKKTAAPVYGPESLSDRIDAMIENYSAQIRAARRQDAGASYVSLQKNAEGALFNFSV